jgi:hypothetical protein
MSQFSLRSRTAGIMWWCLTPWTAHQTSTAACRVGGGAGAQSWVACVGPGGSRAHGAYLPATPVGCAVPAMVAANARSRAFSDQGLTCDPRKPLVPCWLPAVGTIFGIYKAKNPGSGKYSLEDVMRVRRRGGKGGEGGG